MQTKILKLLIINLTIQITVTFFQSLKRHMLCFLTVKMIDVCFKKIDNSGMFVQREKKKKEKEKQKRTVLPPLKDTFLTVSLHSFPDF